MMEVFLSPTAFLSMVAAAIEVYSKETVGVLIGLKGGNKIWVEYAVPIQTAERDEGSVTWTGRSQNRVERFMVGSTGLEIVGEFHSHPYAQRKVLFPGMNQLSASDIRSWDPRNLEVVIGLVKNGGIDKGGNRLKWAHLSRGTLQGAIGDYALRMTAWCSPDGLRKSPSIAFIRCPFATGMDR